MYILDIFFKRRKFINIFEKTWQAIGDKISLVQDSEDEKETQRELFYFVSVVYCSVFQSALAAGMDESSAHYLARIQTKKSKVDGEIVSAVEKMFSTPENDQQQSYVDLAHKQIGPIARAQVDSSVNLDPVTIQASLDDLHREVEKSGFTGVAVESGSA